jgi:pimeloyl-ACP methyl ester carboxylesterase
MLEVIDKGTVTKAHPVPLLFVHGAAHGAWCWDEHFLDFFADKGYRAVALSLRGHGGSPPVTSINSCSIADYVDDVREVANGLPTAPVLVGHSTGGFVVQKYLESHPSPAGVLMASAPPRTYATAQLRFAIRHPWLAAKVNVTRNPLNTYDGAARVREILFSAHTPEPIVEECFSRLSRESYRVVAFDMSLTNRVRPENLSAPLLIIGGECDGHITLRELRATARAYNLDPVVIPRMGHNLMLEPGWAAVAERIHTWLAGQGL